MLHVSPEFSVPKHEFRFSYARSSGPGGQNVNKVNSKVVLTWPILHSASVPADIKHRFIKKYGGKVNKAGELILTSQRYRDQGRNVADCLEKLQLLLASVEHAPKRRIATRRTTGSKQRRLTAKKHLSTQKRLRREPHGE